MQCVLLFPNNGRNERKSLCPQNTQTRPPKSYGGWMDADEEFFFCVILRDLRASPDSSAARHAVVSVLQSVRIAHNRKDLFAQNERNERKSLCPQNTQNTQKIENRIVLSVSGSFCLF